MAALENLEKSLDEMFVKNAPFQLPENAKKFIVQYLPYFNLFFGVVSLWAAWSLYSWANTVNKWVDYANELTRSFGGADYVSSSRFTATLWLSIILLTVQAVLWIGAFPGTRDKKKSGWNLLFIALLVNVVYGVAVMFTDYGNFGSLIGTLISTVVGLYFLFQIRSHYTTATASSVKSPTTPKATAATAPKPAAKKTPTKK